MKYAFMSFSCPQLALDEMLALAAKLGYDGIEPRLAAGHRHGIETTIAAAERLAIRQQVADSPIALACLATSCQYANPEKVAANIEETRRCIDLAGDLGCKRLRVFGGVLPAGVSREQALDLLTDALRQAADRAEARGVTVCVETHDDWSHPAHLAEVMRRVDHPAIGINWDLMHPVRQGQITMDEAFAIVRPWIRHVHFHDGTVGLDTLELRPIGTGGVDHGRAVELLQAMPYTGYLSGEWINWEPYEMHLPRELAAMKAYEGTG
jgi:sugar phosphate isomerase/epimerase